MTLLIIDMDFQPGIDCTTFHSFFLNFEKLAGLWLVGEVDNHVAIYESKVAEGFSAFQRRSCLNDGACGNVMVIERFRYT